MTRDQDASSQAKFNAEAVDDLRHAMARVREAQIAGGLSVNRARYDIETDGINTAFLKGFLGALPLGFVYPGNYAGDKIPNVFTVEDPVYIRFLARLGVFLNGRVQGADYGDKLTPGLVIGERARSEDGASFTELLIASEKRAAGKDGFWVPSPAVYSTTVSSHEWNVLREQATTLLTTPYDSEIVLSHFNPSLQAIDVGSGDFDVPNLEEVRDVKPEKPRAMARALGGMTKLSRHKLGCGSVQVRTLRSTDFEEFDVMTHLETIAAAFDVGEQFDALKAARDAQMPQHYAEAQLGINGYRQVVENDIKPPILPA